MMTFIFVLYLAITVGIAVYAAMKTKTNTDFVLGGKQLSGFSLALSERSTGESAWLLLGLTGEFFFYGYQIVWIAAGCMLGIYFIWFAMSSRIRKYAETSGALTLTGMISKRFPGSEKAIGISSASIIIFFFMFYIAAQFTGSGKIVQDTFGLEPFWGNLVGSVIVIFYCMLGGFIAVVLTDVFQAILMIVTLIVLPIIAIYIIASNDSAVTSSIMTSIPEYTSTLGNTTGIATLLMILSGLSWALGYTGQPQLLTRMMAFRSEKDVRTGRWVALGWTLIAYFGAAIIGITGYILAKSGYFTNDSEFLFANANNAERILPVMIMHLVGPLVAGILLSGAVSAMMSTASSELILCSSSFTEDIFGHFKKVNSKTNLLMNRFLTLLLGAVALSLAFFMKDTVYGLVSYAWSGVGSSFGPAMVLLLFWKKFSRAGLFASFFFGTTSTIVWKMFFLESTGVSERLTSYIFTFIMAVLFSYWFPEKNK